MGSLFASMDARLLGSPLGQAAEVSLIEGDRLQVRRDLVAWIGEGAEVQDSSWGGIGSLLGQGSPVASHLQSVVTASLPNGKVGLAAGLGTALVAIKPPPPMFVLAQALAAADGGASWEKVKAKTALQGEHLECWNCSLLILRAYGGATEMTLGYGQRLSVKARQVIALEEDLVKEPGRPPKGMISLCGPGRVWLQCAVPPVVNPQRKN